MFFIIECRTQTVCFRKMKNQQLEFLLSCLIFSLKGTAMHTNILRTASQKKSQGSESSLAKSNMIDFAPDIYFVSKL